MCHAEPAASQATTALVVVLLTACVCVRERVCVCVCKCVCACVRERACACMCQRDALSSPAVSPEFLFAFASTPAELPPGPVRRRRGALRVPLAQAQVGGRGSCCCYGNIANQRRHQNPATPPTREAKHAGAVARGLDDHQCWQHSEKHDLSPGPRPAPPPRSDLLAGGAGFRPGPTHPE